MDWEYLDYETLTANGLAVATTVDGEIERSEDFAIWSYWVKDGWLWKVNWLEDKDVFCWHVDASALNKQRAIDIGSTSMKWISEMFDNGERPFDTIRWK